MFLDRAKPRRRCSCPAITWPTFLRAQVRRSAMSAHSKPAAGTASWSSCRTAAEEPAGTAGPGDTVAGGAAVLLVAAPAAAEDGRAGHCRGDDRGRGGGG